MDEVKLKKVSEFLNGFSKNLVAIFSSIFSLVASGKTSYWMVKSEFKVSGYTPVDFLIFFAGIILIIFGGMKLFSLDKWVQSHISPASEYESIGRSIGSIVGFVLAIAVSIVFLLLGK